MPGRGTRSPQVGLLLAQSARGSSSTLSAAAPLREHPDRQLGPPPLQGMDKGGLLPWEGKGTGQHPQQRKPGVVPTCGAQGRWEAVQCPPRQLWASCCAGHSHCVFVWLQFAINMPQCPHGCTSCLPAQEPGAAPGSPCPLPSSVRAGPSAHAASTLAHLERAKARPLLTCGPLATLARTPV